MNNARPNGKNSTEAIHTKLDSYAQMNESLKDRLYKSSHDESIQLTEYEKNLRVQEVFSLDVAFKFYKLSSIAVDIIMYLHFNGGQFEGNYSDLTVALGRKSGPKGHTPNIRSMCLKLQEQGIIQITYNRQSIKGNPVRPTRIDLNPHWIDKI
jgi:hypothetical protein